MSVQQATNQLVGMSVGDKDESLYQHGTDLDDLPNWQKRGTGVYWEEYEKQAWNP